MRNFPGAWGLYAFAGKNGYEAVGSTRFRCIGGVWNKDSEQERLMQIRLTACKLYIRACVRQQNPRNYKIIRGFIAFRSNFNACPSRDVPGLLPAAPLHS